MTKEELTKDTIEKAAPKKTDFVIWDTEMRGLCLRISPTGNKTFIYQYRIGTRSRKYKIGSGGPFRPLSPQDCARVGGQGRPRYRPSD